MHEPGFNQQMSDSSRRKMSSQFLSCLLHEDGSRIPTPVSEYFLRTALPRNLDVAAADGQHHKVPSKPCDFGSPTALGQGIRWPSRTAFTRRPACISLFEVASLCFDARLLLSSSVPYRSTLHNWHRHLASCRKMQLVFALFRGMLLILRNAL